MMAQVTGEMRRQGLQRDLAGTAVRTREDFRHAGRHLSHDLG